MAISGFEAAEAERGALDQDEGRDREQDDSAPAAAVIATTSLTP